MPGIEPEAAGSGSADANHCLSLYYLLTSTEWVRLSLLSHCPLSRVVQSMQQPLTCKYLNLFLVSLPEKSDTFLEGQTSRQEVGNDVILHCSSDREVHLCRWKTPYLNTYIVGEGIYVERGRIQWLGKDPNSDCTIRSAPAI